MTKQTKQIVATMENDVESGTASNVAERVGNEGLTDTDRSEHDDVALRFDPGPRYRFGRITVRTDSRLNSDVIDGMIPVHEGDPYSSEALADVRASLDSGNAAYKAKDYDRARAHYQRVTDIDKDEPAGWFGIYMVELALGNAEAAGKALDKAQGMVPGATLRRSAARLRAGSTRARH